MFWKCNRQNQKVEAGKIIRIIFSAVFSVMFLADQSWAASLAPVQSQIPFSIPEEFAQIEKIHVSGEPGPWVIHIQDPHCVVEAQKNIQQLINYLEKQFDVRYVYLEGGEGRLNPSRVRLEERNQKEVLNDYLNLGQVSGAEIACVMNGGRGNYFGIENQMLLELNRDAYVQAIETRSQRDDVLSLAEDLWNNKGEKTISSPVQIFAEHMGFYLKGHFALADFFSYLAWMFSEEVERLVTPEEFPRLYQLKTVYLKEPESHKAMIERKGYFEEEMSGLLKRLETVLVTAPAEKEWFDGIKQLYVLFSASRLELMRHDYETFRAAFKNLSERQGALVKFVGADWADQATKFFAPVIKFYDLVLKRDRIMSANLLKRFGVDKPVVAILVTGGFHSKGIDEILESKRVSTVVVTPRFSDLTGKENYSHVLKKSK